MKKLLFKYFLLIILTFITSIIIYNYIESFKPIKTENDVLSIQDKIEDDIIKNTSFTIDSPKVILNPYGNSPLSALIIFQTNDLTTSTVTIKGKNSNDITHTFIPSKLHILPIYGLYPDYENKIIIEASEKQKEITIKTDKLPDDFPQIKSVDTSSSDEFYFTAFKDSKYACAYDSFGDVRWYMNGDYNWDIQRLNNGHILTGSNKTIYKNYSASMIEMDLLGKEYFEYVIPGGYHHGFTELSNGNLLVTSSSNKDCIVEIDRNTGDIVKQIDLESIIKDSNITSITYDSNTNSVLLTLFEDNKIISIDYATLDINFIAGKDIPKNLNEYAFSSDKINMPNSISIDNGNIKVVSDDGGNKYYNEYKINYNSRSLDLVNSDNIGANESAVVYDDIKILGNSIYDEDEKISFDKELYSSRKMSLYANDIYTTVKGKRLGKLGISKTIKDYPILKTYDASEIFKKYDIKLYKDVFGLKVSGKFNKNDKVQIILDNVLDKKAYELKVSENISSRYISEDGIKGKYYIYLNINGKIYKLYKYVNYK